MRDSKTVNGASQWGEKNPNSDCDIGVNSAAKGWASRASTVKHTHLILVLLLLLMHQSSPLKANLLSIYLVPDTILVTSPTFTILQFPSNIPGMYDDHFNMI